MKNKILCESLEEFRLLEKSNEPLALAILGAPAGGKSFTMDNIKKFVKDQRIGDTIDSGVALTVDKLRDEFQSKNPLSQMVGFVRAFYYIRRKNKEDSVEYGKWFNDIYTLWEDKIAKLAPALKITIDKNHVYFNGIPAYKNLKALKNPNYSPKEVIEKLHYYNDYKRVIRYFQNLQQSKAIKKTYNISYDESGDEPKKIINSLKQLHKRGYVTDVFLIHPENVASNLIMNYYRVLVGGDGGRDSSEAIVSAYLDIERSKQLYSTNAEDDLKTTSKQLQTVNKNSEKIGNTIENANVPDDKSRGDKPIDVFTEVSTMKPVEAFKYFAGELDKKDKNLKFILLALLKYRMYSIKNLPENAKSILELITKSINNKQALNILKKAAASKKFVYQSGGITPELIIKAETYLK